MSSARLTRRHSRFAACLLGGLAAACAHGGSAAHPDEHVEPAAPHLREPEAHAAVAMPDPQVAQDVTLDAILAYADAHAPALGVARSTRARAEAAHVGAEVLLPANPEVHLALGPRMTNEGTGVDFAAGVSQRFEIAGERGLRLSAADRLAELSDAQIERLRWSVHCDVHAAFHEAIVAREQAVLADSAQGFQEEVLRIVERQIAAGETAPLTLRLAQAEVAQARQAALAAHQRHYAARLSLAAQAGWPPELPPTPRGELDAPHDPPELEALLALARSRLPELAEREAAVREAQARAVAEDRASWIKPELGAQYTREDNQGAEGTNHVVLGTLTLPVPAVENNQGARASARADLYVARAELDAARSLLVNQVARARSEVVAAAARVRAYGTEILPRLVENLSLLRRSFELGEIDLMELSIGRERFLRIQSDALVGHLDYFVALAGLERAVGADLWRDEQHEGHGP